MSSKEKKSFSMPTSYTILLSIIIVLGLLTYLIPEVKNASFADVFMAPVRGMEKAVDISFFILMIGGFLGVMSKTGALDSAIYTIVKKMKGKEIWLIPIIMFIFSLGGTSYGMAEETIAFYGLIVATMIAAKMDSIVGVATIMLGAGSGVLGSTVNPFAIGVAVSSLKDSNPDIVVRQSVILLLGSILWISTLIITSLFVVNYAKKIKSYPSRTLLTKSEIDICNDTYGKKNEEQKMEFTTSMKISIILFVLAFVIMVVSVIPWKDFGITIFQNTGFVTGVPLGEWYFKELQMLFLFSGIVIGIFSGIKEKSIVKYFIDGAAEMIGVALIVGISRGISVLLATTEFDKYILNGASNLLNGVPAVLFAIGSYFIYIILSFLIPSTSGLASASMPTFGALTANLNLSPEVMIVIFSAASGLVNMITPTSGVVMGGLAIGKVEYSTWVKFVLKILSCVMVVNLAILCIAMVVIK